MAYQINVLPSGRQFQAEDGETILAAALRQGIGCLLYTSDAADEHRDV